MSTDLAPDSVLAATLRQLITAIQLMQTAVDGLNIVIESNTAMSNALTAALSAIGSPAPASFTAPTTSNAAAPAPAPTTSNVAAATESAAPAVASAVAQSAAPAVASAAAQSADLTSTVNLGVTVAEDTIPWYAVIVGRNPGVFYGSDGVPENVDRIPGGKVIRYVTGRQDAIDGFSTFLDAGRVERVQLSITRTVLHSGDSSIPGLS